MYANQQLSPSCFSSTDRTTASWFDPIWSGVYQPAETDPIVGLDFGKIAEQQRLSPARANRVAAAPNWWHLSGKTHEALANRPFPPPVFSDATNPISAWLGVLGFGQLTNPSGPIGQDD